MAKSAPLMGPTAIIAFGTRGDVQPVALVAKLYALRGSTVRFVTHAEHLGWLNEIFGDKSSTLEAGFEGGAIILVPVATPAIVNTSGETSTASRELWSTTQQNVCLAACLGGDKSAGIKFDLPVTLVAFNLFALEGLVIADVAGLPCAALHPYPLPTHWQPAGRVSSDTCSLSASDRPNSCNPASNRFPFPGGLQTLQTRLREEWPHLYNQLYLASARNHALATAVPSFNRVDGTTTADDNVSGACTHGNAEFTASRSSETKFTASQSSASLSGSVQTSQCSSMSLEEVELWAWPVVASPHWQAFRKRTSHYWQQQSIRIGQTRQTSNSPESRATSQHLHVNASSRCLYYERFVASGSSPPLTSCQRRAPCLLYGHCSASLPRRADWPLRAVDTGAWAHRSPPSPSPLSSPSPPSPLQPPPLPDELVAFLRSGSGDNKVVYVNLGAAWASLPHSTRLPFARALLAACVSIGRRVLVHLPRKNSAPRDPNIEGATSESISQHQGSRENCSEDIGDENDVGTLLEDAFIKAEEELAQRYGRPEESESISISGSNSTAGVADQPQQILMWRRGPISPSLLYTAHCCGVVHHGGSGSVLSAATSGLPQLPLPFFFDQPLWARRVSALGLDGSPVLSCSSKDDNIEERNQSNLVVSLQSLVAVGSNQDEIEVEEVTRRRDLAEAEVNFTTALTAALAHCLSPPSRLRAACFGKRLRDELWPDETPLMTAKSTAATTPNDAATSSIGNAATRAAAGTKEVATNAAALESAKDLSLFALAATHGFSRGVAVAVEHLEHIEQSEQISERAAATLKAAEKAAYSHDAIGGVGGNGRAEQKYDNDQGEEEEHDELELPNKLWVESISHEETAFLYREIFVDEEYDWPPAATRAAKDTTASTSASIRAASAPPNGATHGFVANFMAKVRQDDVVLDVGANTGLFAIWLLERAHAHALATITTPEADASASVTAAAAQAPVDAPFRLVCIEPAPLTAAALRRNLNRFSHPNSTWVVEAAVVGPSTYPSSNSTSSSSSSSGSVGHGSANTMELCFLPHLPGNSHLAAYASEREGQEAAVLGPSPVSSDRLALVKRLFSGRQRVTVNTRTLSDLVRETLHVPQLSGSESGSTESGSSSAEVYERGPRIALLKVDVEGAELDVLSSLSAPMWQLVDRVVAEVHNQELLPVVADPSEACERDQEGVLDAAATQADDVPSDNTSHKDGCIVGDNGRSRASGAGRTDGSTDGDYDGNGRHKWRLGGRVAAVDFLLRNSAGFAHVVWARPGLCRDNDQSNGSSFSGVGAREAEDEETSSALNNWMVYAAREPFE